MKYFLTVILITFAFSQQQPVQTRYSVDDIMKKLEAIDRKVDSIGAEFDKKLNASSEKLKESLTPEIERLNSRFDDLNANINRGFRRISSQITSQRKSLPVSICLPMEL